WRKNRKDKTFMVIPSRIFNYLVGRLWGVRLHDYNCGLKIYTKNAAKSLDLYGGMHRFIPLLLHQKGFSVSEIPTEHQKRMFGKSKYGFSKVFKDLPDMFTMFFLNRYSNRPMHFFGLIGGLMLFMGTVFLTYLTIIWLMGESIGGRPLLFLGMLLVIAGFQLFFTGFLADLIIHSSRGSKQSDLLLKYETEK
ncbi:glycosyltransferase, partial [Patescibacteria group bacterium]|nr:glycosyltransferase [Patescibacteria group bacterium]